MPSTGISSSGGRPPKFDEPSRPVTVTLPERILRLLASVNADRAKAISTTVETVLGTSEPPTKTVELVQIAPGKAIILVAHSRYLESLPWLRLVEIAPARHLISLLPGTSIEKLEVAIHDLLDVVPDDEPRERELLEALHQNVRSRRRDQKLGKEEILIVESVG